MATWVLVLIVWAGDGSIEGGKFKEVGSEAECRMSARQDTPRVRHLYHGKRYRFECINSGDAERAASPKGT